MYTINEINNIVGKPFILYQFHKLNVWINPQVLGWEFKAYKDGRVMGKSDRCALQKARIRI